ncbi:helix-turn-helix domain-containing protein [Micromonospora sp. CPCC 206061]|uniref:helix-turn-helix domain-containing protein n=1 Tax=Micromonospora sp. CPCC 206061 TaxID=3122410 RepID=UPI002FEFEDC3
MASRDQLSFRALLLGRLMRDLRDRSGLTIKSVAVFLGVDVGPVRRLERGEWVPAREQMVALLDVYREHDAGRDGLLRLAEAAWPSRSEVDFDGAVPDESFADLLWLEFEASEIRCYSPALIPDLLQTAEYAEHFARTTLGRSVLPEQVNARMELAAQRQQILCRRREQMVSEFVLDECVLRHPVGDPAVWSGQLQHLARMADLPHVQIDVRPAKAGTAQSPGGFTVFGLRPPNPPFVVHVEYLGGRLFLENGYATSHLRVFDQLRKAAVDLDTSIVSS